MISIIVCSITPTLCEQFVRSVEGTIGVPVEFLIHDNRELNWGICKVYNYYASIAKYDILCFAHEDILFHSTDWGYKIVRFIDNTPSVGVIGFAGVIMKSKELSGWNGAFRPYQRINLIQTYGDRTKVYSINPLKEEFSQVVCLDGLCLFVPKKVWLAASFDELSFPGFHLYDLSFSFQSALQFENYVCHTIEIEHLSAGSFSKAWYEASKIFHQKWANYLPLWVPPFSEKDLQRCENRVVYENSKTIYLSKFEDWSIGELISRLWLKTKSGGYLFKFLYFVFLESKCKKKYHRAT